MLRKLIIAFAIAIAVALLAVPPPLFLAASQRALFPWLDLDQNRFWVGAPAPGEPDTPQPARHHEQRRTECKESLIEAEPAVADKWWSVGKADLAGKGVSHSVAFGLVKVIGIVRQEQMGYAVLGDQALPVRPAEDEIVDGAEHTPSMAMRECHGFVLQRRDANGAQVLAKFLRVSAKIVMVPVGIPGAEGRPRQRRQSIEKRAYLTRMACHDVTRDRHQVRLALHQ